MAASAAPVSLQHHTDEVGSNPSSSASGSVASMANPPVVKTSAGFAQTAPPAFVA